MPKFDGAARPTARQALRTPPPIVRIAVKRAASAWRPPSLPLPTSPRNRRVIGCPRPCRRAFHARPAGRSAETATACCSRWKAALSAHRRCMPWRAAPVTQAILLRQQLSNRTRRQAGWLRSSSSPAVRCYRHRCSVAGRASWQVRCGCDVTRQQVALPVRLPAAPCSPAWRRSLQAACGVGKSVSGVVPAGFSPLSPSSLAPLSATSSAS